MTYRVRGKLSAARAATALVLALSPTSAMATDIGLSQFRIDTNNAYLGQGIVVAQPEASPDSGLGFEISAGNPSLTVPLTYVYYDSAAQAIQTITNPTASAYASGHADQVAQNLAGLSNGVAPNLTRILNYDATIYVDYYVLRNLALVNFPKVINQSFIETPDDRFTAPVLEQFFDNYVTARHYIICTAAGNGGDVQVPGTAYNVITVGAYQGASSVSQPGQPAKPDIVAPADFTSFATPIVSGVAALLVQVAGSGDGTDTRVVKALLLNGATKPSDWTHSAAVPLDRVYGAGIVNIDTSYRNLIAGEHTASGTTATSVLGGAHLPIATGNVGAAGWNLKTINSSASTDAVDHYVIDLSQSNAIATLTATLTWQRANNLALTNEFLANATNPDFTNFTTSMYTINNLDMYLYNVTTQQQVDLSNSTVDNVEQLLILNLTPGKYDLQVLKNGGNVGTANVFSNSESYGLAWAAGTLSNVTNVNTLSFTQANSVTIATPITGSGTLSQLGSGTTILSAYQGTGAINVAAGRLVLSGSVQPPVRTPSLTIAGTSTAPAGALDIKDGGLIVSYTGSGTAQTAAMYDQVTAGKGTRDVHSQFTYNGNGITSSAARSNNLVAGLDLYAIGVLNNADLSAFGITPPYNDTNHLFMGQAVDANTILVRYTYAGDINLDGVINIDDYNYIDTAFASPSSYPGGWIAGDFNHDGVINIDDYNVIDTAFAFQSAPLGGGLSALLPSGSAAAPEPSALALLSLGGLALLRRNRRRPSGGDLEPCSFRR